jgi:hypothetical protein
MRGRVKRVRTTSNEVERVVTRDDSTRVFYYIFLKHGYASGPMVVAAAADAVSAVTSHTIRRAIELHGV